MLHITDRMIDDLVGPAAVEEALVAAFRAFDRGEAGIQERVRTYAGGVRLSTLGALLPEQEFAGAKVYTTIGGAFSFAIVLFSSRSGELLAILDANAITRLRTAACSVIAARYLARSSAKRLAIFGLGVQGREHAKQFAEAFRLEEILLCSQRRDPAIAVEITNATKVPARLATTEEALASADMIVTASRSKTPLFAGDAIRAGTFIAAVGSSLPTSRELDDTALVRASTIAIEWREQSLKEAGELVQAGAGVVDPAKIVELGELISGRKTGRTDDQSITVYKSVGVGLEDIAIAGLAWRRAVAG
ncbi:MAG: ornithine cyclodeaminase family protein [Bauldia sp.]|nr:ornithine cyclodeaminase family protein [Bauldia sp.]